MTSKKLLVVDDSATLRAALRMLLENAGFQVLEAENGRAALEVVQRELPDLILLDLQMPVLNGWQTLGALRRDFRSALIPVIAVSGLEQLERADLQAAGFCSFLLKPFTVRQLLSEVARCLSRDHVPGACEDRSRRTQVPPRAA